MFQRVELLTGKDTLEKFKNTKVLVFGLGGVGSWCAEALVRSGIGKIDLIDFDTIAESNLNRQVQANSKNIGQLKAEVLQKRLLEINPACEVNAINKMFSVETAAKFDFNNADYVIDAIDTLQNKLDLIETCCAANITLFSSMGMARKIDPTQIETASIWKTSNCPLAKLVREGLRKRNFRGDFTVVYSKENIARKEEIFTGEILAGEILTDESAAGRKIINGSIVTVTASAGMILASLVLQDLMRKK